MRHSTSIAGFALGACLLATAAQADNIREVIVESPSGKNRIMLSIESANIRYAVERDGKPVVEPSVIDVRLAGAGALAEGAAIQGVSERTIDESDELVWGKSNRIRDHCRATTVRLKGKSGIEWDIELRAYDDGVALRYGIPKQDALEELAIQSESTEFRLAGEPSLLFMALDHFKTSHEAEYRRQPLSELPQDKLIAVPLLAVWKDGRAAAITEARLRHFAGMYLEKLSAASPGRILQTRLAPLPNNPAAVVMAKAPHWSPWRVVLLADHAGELIESNMLLALNDAPEGDFNWLEPGKTTWHWWNGTVEHGPASTPLLNFAIHKHYIDFCAKHGIEYHAVSSVAENRPWYVQRDPGFAWPHDDTDILKVRSDLDLQRIIDYATEKGVGIRLWVNWKPLEDKLDEAFATYERWGVKGLMIDFMDRDDQEMVEWQERALEAAARHKLHIQFHGSYKPTGEQRTFPNLFNREGVLNLEYLKWTDKCSPPHTVNVAYTRGLAGQVDYHLGGFRHATRREFRPRDDRPFVMGTRAHHLALYVVFENPMPMVSDVPTAYEGAAGFEFIAEVPTTWDETRYVAGDAGEYIVIARRSGKTWYLGGITNWTARDVSLPLGFLGEGKFEATIYEDVSKDGEKPNEVNKETRAVDANSKLEVTLASGGGVAAVIRLK